MSSSVFIRQVSIDHTFGSHRITHLAKLQEIAAVVPVYEKTYWPVYKRPLPSENIGRAYVHRKEKIMNHSKNERIKSWWLHCGVVIGRDIYIYIVAAIRIALSSRNSKLKSFLKIRILANIPPKHPYRWTVSRNPQWEIENSSKLLQEMILRNPQWEI